MGYFGIHRFYAGKKKSGWLYLFTLGMFGIGWVIDIVVLSIKLFATHKPRTQAERTLKEETFPIAGVSYYESNIQKLATVNPDWKISAKQIVDHGKAGKRIFKNYYVNKPVKLQQEPDNPHDENAIAVFIAGELVGYISRTDNIHVNDILNHREIISVSGFIGGGEYKIVDEEYKVFKAENGFNVKVRIKYI